MEYSDEAHAELAKSKVLSMALCDHPLTSNANKCILVYRQAAMYTFGGGYIEHVLTRTGASVFKGKTNPSAIASTLGTKGIECIEHSNVVKDLLDKM